MALKNQLVATSRGRPVERNRTSQSGSVSREVRVYDAENFPHAPNSLDAAALLSCEERVAVRYDDFDREKAISRSTVSLTVVGGR